MAQSISVHLSNQYSSLITIALYNVRKNKKIVRITIRVLLFILEDFLLSLDIFGRHPKLNICWLQKYVF